MKPEKKADISQRHHWFPREMTSEKRTQKFHTADASLPRSGSSFWLVVPRKNFPSTNQKHYPDLGSDASSVWNFWARFSDVIFAVKPVVASLNVGCFLRLSKYCATRKSIFTASVVRCWLVHLMKSVHLNEFRFSVYGVFLSAIY